MLADMYGLLTVGKPPHADALPPEPLDVWHREIRVLRTVQQWWDTGKNAALVARHITERLARTPSHLTAYPDGNGRIAPRYRPVFLIDALWQQFAREVAGVCEVPGAQVRKGPPVPPTVGSSSDEVEIYVWDGDPQLWRTLAHEAVYGWLYPQSPAVLSLLGSHPRR